jgi:hypothetical protein
MQYQAALGGSAEIKFGELPMHQCRFGIKMFLQQIGAAPQQVQHRRQVVPGNASGFPKQANALS